MHRTTIEYLTDCWNPTVGCKGLGCAVSQKCWAYRQAKRQKHRCSLCYAFVPHVHFERFDEPLKRKKPSRIGVSFMGEFFSKDISDWIRSRLYMTMEKCPQHIFIIFTKQPQNIDLDEPLPANVWVGTSVNKKEDLWRIDTLRDIPTSVKIGSFEPLLENIDADLTGIQWVIIGAQTRPNFQPKPKWVANLVSLARIYGAKVFLKNNLFPRPMSEHYQEYPLKQQDYFFSK